MPKRSWNDINDSDSSLSSASEEVQEAPSITKRVSAPSTSITAKLKSACDQMSLRKIEKHEASDVWLYVPNSYFEKCETVNVILDSRSELKKVLRVKSIGWNVLTTKQIGRRLIQEGLDQDGIAIKFIYSNRNDDKISKNEQRPPKVQKKVTYIQKIVPQTQLQAEETNQQSNIKMQSKKIESSSQILDKRSDRVDKKKVKWVQKSKSMKEEVSTINCEQVKSPPKLQKNAQSTITYRSPKKWEDSKPIQVKSPKKFIQKEVLKEETAQQQAKLSMNDTDEPISTAVKINNPGDLSNDNKQKQENLSDQSSQKSQEKKKKKKKNNKKSRQPKNEKPNQNPYSYFMK